MYIQAYLQTTTFSLSLYSSWSLVQFLRKGWNRSQSLIRRQLKKGNEERKGMTIGMQTLTYVVHCELNWDYMTIHMQKNFSPVHT